MVAGQQRQSRPRGRASAIQRQFLSKSRAKEERADTDSRDRKVIAKLMKEASPGDMVVVTRLDRLARSTRDLLNLLATISERGASFRSLRDTQISDL